MTTPYLSILEQGDQNELLVGSNHDSTDGYCWDTQAHGEELQCLQVVMETREDHSTIVEELHHILGVHLPLLDEGGGDGEGGGGGGE